MMSFFFRSGRNEKAIIEKDYTISDGCSHWDIDSKIIFRRVKK